MTMLRARFDGRVLVPTEPVDLPRDQLLNVQSEPVTKPTSALPVAKLVEIAQSFSANPGTPTDAAAQHDHYLYGTPKRQ